MFYYLNGTLALLDANLCVIDCDGVGYQLTISQMTLDTLGGKIGSTVKLYTHLAVREDGVELFGFGSNEERIAFNRLTSVSGVGAKVAMSVLSTFTPEKLSYAICTEDVKAISRANGVGAKTAARIVLELKDKIAKETPDAPSAALSSSPAANVRMSGNLSEATEGLQVLGYDKSAILSALRDIDPQTEVGEIIRIALKRLSSR